jgi:hypothetical protein
MLGYRGGDILPHCRVEPEFALASNQAPTFGDGYCCLVRCGKKAASRLDVHV